jgi:hypothetical protein
MANDNNNKNKNNTLFLLHGNTLREQLDYYLFRTIRTWALQARNLQYDQAESVEALYDNPESAGDRLEPAIYQLDETIREGDAGEWVRNWAASKWWLMIPRTRKTIPAYLIYVYTECIAKKDGHYSSPSAQMMDES